MKKIAVLQKIVYYILYEVLCVKVGITLRKGNRDVAKVLVMISQIGISMVIAILGSCFIGLKLDEWFSTRCFFIIFLIIGIVAAFRNLYHQTKGFYAADLEREQKEQDYFRELEREREKAKNKRG